MAYIIDGKRVLTVPHNTPFEYESPCTEDGHEYAEIICPCCGRDFCYSCSGGSNVSQGGKYEEDYQLCPSCGHDIYS